MIIYCIRNRKNGRVYIGQTTKSIRSRWGQHKRARPEVRAKLKAAHARRKAIRIGAGQQEMFL